MAAKTNQETNLTVRALQEPHWETGKVASFTNSAFWNIFTASKLHTSAHSCFQTRLEEDTWCLYLRQNKTTPKSQQLQPVVSSSPLQLPYLSLLLLHQHEASEDRSQISITLEAVISKTIISLLSSTVIPQIVQLSLQVLLINMDKLWHSAVQEQSSWKSQRFLKHQCRDHQTSDKLSIIFVFYRPLSMTWPH